MPHASVASFIFQYLEIICNLTYSVLLFPSLDVSYESVVECVLFVLAILLALNCLPLSRAELGEECIGILRGVVNLGQAQYVGMGHGTAVEHFAADDIYNLLIAAVVEGTLKGVEGLCTRE